MVEWSKDTGHLHDDVVEKFAANYQVDPSGCWVWQGSLHGSIRREYRVRLPSIPHFQCQKDKVRFSWCGHRFSWSIHHKEALGTNDEIRRTCLNILCVNPAHLVKGTRVDTINSMVKRGTTQVGNQHAKKHKHAEMVEDHRNGMSYNAIMTKYNIKSKGTISYIIKKSKASE